MAASGVALVEEAGLGAPPNCPPLPVFVASIGGSVIDPIATIMDPCAHPSKKLAKHSYEPEPILAGFKDCWRRGVQPRPPPCQVVSSEVSVPLSFFESAFLDKPA